LGKLEALPFKVLFYLGFTVVITFLGLSYWQLSSHYEDASNLESLNEYQNLLGVSIADVNNLSEFQYIQIEEPVYLLHSWLLRSRVHNGQNGYNRIDLISDSYNNYMVVNRGWVPLDFDLDSIDKSEENKYIGKLMNFDNQTIGQDDIPQSNYLFRIDKLFIENEKNITLQEFYITLTDECGENIECINITEPYDAPHLSYAFQWLFFAICLSIVILRKNKLI
jgi:cytochrome oxidase assembly protein ShyY1|tara:strand:+ start:43 stop:711 length:669 start_codon:yes stop_codon:yes gene_type:complete